MNKEQERAVEEAKRLAQQLQLLKLQRLEMLVQQFRTQCVQEMDEPLRSFKKAQQDDFQNRCSVVRGLVKEKRAKAEKAAEEVDSFLRTFEGILDSIAERKESLEQQFFEAKEALLAGQELALGQFRAWRGDFLAKQVQEMKFRADLDK